MTRQRRFFMFKNSGLKAELSDRARRYTLLVAWHKFDRYERIVLQGLLKVPFEKLPFISLGTVWDILTAYESQFRYNIYTKSEYPTRDYRKRIMRAALKEERKRRQRIK